MPGRCAPPSASAACAAPGAAGSRRTPACLRCAAGRRRRAMAHPRTPTASRRVAAGGRPRSGGTRCPAPTVARSP